MKNLKTMLKTEGKVAVELYCGKAYKGAEKAIMLKNTKCIPTRPAGVENYSTKMDERFVGRKFALSFTPDSSISDYAKDHWNEYGYSATLHNAVKPYMEKNNCTQEVAVTKLLYLAMYNGAKAVSIHVRTLNEKYTDIVKAMIVNGVDVEIIESSTLDAFDVPHVANLKCHSLRQCFTVYVDKSQVENVKAYYLKKLSEVEVPAYEKARVAMEEVTSMITRRKKEDHYTRVVAARKYAAQTFLELANKNAATKYDIQSVEALKNTALFEKMCMNVRIYGPAYGIINVRTFQGNFSKVMVNGLTPVDIPRRLEGASFAAKEDYIDAEIARDIALKESLKKPKYAGFSKNDYWEYEEMNYEYPLSDNEWNAYHAQKSKANADVDIAEIITANTQIMYLYESDRYGNLDSGYGLCPHCGCPVRLEEADATTLDANLHHTGLYHEYVTCQYCDTVSHAEDCLHEPAEDIDYVLPEVAADTDAVVKEEEVPEYSAVEPTVIYTRNPLTGELEIKKEQ